MNIIIHDMPVDQNKDFYAKLSAGALKDYRDVGMDDKNKAITAVILGCVPHASTICSRANDFNKKELAVTGGSRGGAATLITSGLDPRVTLAAPNVAAMCDHSGMAFDHVSDWPLANACQTRRTRCSKRRRTTTRSTSPASSRANRCTASASSTFVCGSHYRLRRVQCAPGRR